MFDVSLTAGVQALAIGRHGPTVLASAGTADIQGQVSATLAPLARDGSSAGIRPAVSRAAAARLPAPASAPAYVFLARRPAPASNLARSR